MTITHLLYGRQALSFFYGDWDVLWDAGYRMYSDWLGIMAVTPKVTSSFRGLRPYLMRRMVPDEAPGDRYAHDITLCFARAFPEVNVDGLDVWGRAF
jgi:hypothetical protein